MLFTYLLLAFAVITAINCLFYLLFLKFGFCKHKKEQETTDPVSIIVYIKNQEKRIEQFLEKLLAQSYPNFEIVLVNNASSDNSLEALENFKETHHSKPIHIVDVVNNEAFWGSKKYALTLGIKKASHEKLLFITPSAEVIPENWVASLIELFTEDKELVIGYENFEKKKGFFGKLMRFNRFQSFLQNFGLGSYSTPYFASENNLAYSSALFFETNGFSTHMNVPGGTENLFIKDASSSQNTTIATHKEIRVYSKILSFKNWFLKTKTHQQAFGKFSGGIKFSLFIFYFSQLLFLIAAIAGGIFFQNLIWLSLIGVRYLVVGLSFAKSAFKLGEKDLFYLFPFLEIFNVLIQLFIFISNIFSKPTH